MIFASVASVVKAFTTYCYSNNTIMLHKCVPTALDASVTKKMVTKVSKYPCKTPMVKLNVPSPSKIVRSVSRKPITATGSHMYWVIAIHNISSYLTIIIYDCNGCYPRIQSEASCSTI